MQHCLQSLGVAFRIGPCGAFWDVNAEELEYILRDAHKAWRDKIKLVHTDYGGTHEASARLNLTWDRVRDMFLAHGVTLEGRRPPMVLKQVRKREPIPLHLRRKPGPKPKLPKLPKVITDARREKVRQNVANYRSRMDAEAKQKIVNDRRLAYRRAHGIPEDSPLWTHGCKTIDAINPQGL